MPEFDVKMVQYVQEVAVVRITADDLEAAKTFARENVDDLAADADWSDGDDSMGQGVVDVIPVMRRAK